jgi:hypothetical protein
MKKLSVLCIALCVGLSTTAAFARGGMGGAHGMGSSHMGMMGMSMMGGAFGTTAAAPGTNSSGTALSSDGVGHPMLDTKPAMDPEDAKVDKMINSICRGC